MDWTKSAGWPNREMSRIVGVRPHRWHIQCAGPRESDAPKLLFLHGAGASSHSWRDVLPPLAENCAVMAVDLPGQGFTRSGARQRCGLDPMAEDIAALLAAEEFAPDAIVGHSAGVAIALRLALDMPAPPKAVIGFNAALGEFPGLAGWLFPMMAKLLAMNPLTAVAFSRMATGASARNLIEGTGSRLDEAGLDLYRRLIRDRAHVDGALAMMAQWSLERLLADLPKVAAPTLLITGETDKAVPPATSSDAAARMQNARHEPWEKLGHLAHEEAPARAVDAIRGFVAEAAG